VAAAHAADVVAGVDGDGAPVGGGGAAGTLRRPTAVNRSSGNEVIHSRWPVFSRTRSVLCVVLRPSPLPGRFPHVVLTWL
jgi:hypothetical protein